MMTRTSLCTTCYEDLDQQVSWCGLGIAEGQEFESFIANEVSSRLHDEEGESVFETHLRGLASTGFASKSVDKILAAVIPEERDWAVGEAMAEAYLARHHDIIWPWNMERDKRNPNASLPGADLVGFEIKGDTVRLALGEVKTSGDADSPPNVMKGRSGMYHQIDNLANNLGLIRLLLKWLLFRCKGTNHEPSYNAAISLFLKSGNKAVALFGVLIRDTEPNVLDLQARGRSLARALRDPSTCGLIALYIPCTIGDLPTRISRGRS